MRRRGIKVKTNTFSSAAVTLLLYALKTHVGQLPRLRKHEIEAICVQGVEVVTAIIRPLYEVIKVEDERVQKIVAHTIAAHLQMVKVK